MEIARDFIRVARQLAHQRSFALAAIGTLALGIAAPTALFTIVHATLLRPLPYPRAGDIYTVRTTMTDGRFTSGLVATEELGALTRATDAIATSAYSVRFDDTILTTAQLKQVAGYGVSQEFFDLFGLPMAAGRGFNAEDFAATGTSIPGTVRRVVLSHQLWTSMFGGDPAVVGSTVRLATIGPVLVVGVAGPTFDMPHGAELWFGYPLPENIGHGLVGYVRLRPGTAARLARRAKRARLRRPHEEVPGHGRPSGVRHEVARDGARGRPRPDGGHCVWGDGTASAARALQRREPADRARRVASARHGRAHGARRQPLAAGAAAPDRVARHFGGGVRDRARAGVGGRARDRGRRRLAVAARGRHGAQPDGVPLHRGRDGRGRTARRPRAGADGRRWRARLADERRRPRGAPGTHDAAMAGRDGRGRGHARDCARGRRGTVDSQPGQPARRRSGIHVTGTPRGGRATARRRRTAIRSVWRRGRRTPTPRCDRSAPRTSAWPRRCRCAASGTARSSRTSWDGRPSRGTGRTRASASSIPISSPRSGSRRSSDARSRPPTSGTARRSWWSTTRGGAASYPISIRSASASRPDSSAGRGGPRGPMAPRSSVSSPTCSLPT